MRFLSVQTRFLRNPRKQNCFIIIINIKNKKSILNYKRILVGLVDERVSGGVGARVVEYNIVFNYYRGRLVCVIGFGGFTPLFL